MNKLQIVIIILSIFVMANIKKINKMTTKVSKGVNPIVIGVVFIMIMIILLIKKDKLNNIESFSQENTYFSYLTKLSDNVKAVAVAAVSGEPVLLTHSHGKGGLDNHIHKDHSHEPLTPEPLTPEPLTPEPEAFTY